MGKENVTEMSFKKITGLGTESHTNASEKSHTTGNGKVTELCTKKSHTTGYEKSHRTDTYFRRAHACLAGTCYMHF